MVVDISCCCRRPQRGNLQKVRRRRTDKKVSEQKATTAENWVSGTGNVKKKGGKANIAVVIVNEFEGINEKISDHLIYELLKLLSLNWDDKVLDGNMDTLMKFGIRENEIKTVTKSKYGDLILEKVAMVDIIK